WLIRYEFRTLTCRKAGFLSLRERREVRADLFQFLQNFLDRSTRIRIFRNWPSDDKIIRACLKGLARRHESLLVAGFRPTRPHSRHNQFDFIAELFAQKAYLERARDQSINSSRCAKVSGSK